MGEKEEFTINGFYEFISRGELRTAKCLECGSLMMPPKPVCPSCYSKSLGWVKLSGRGVVETYTIINVPTTILKGHEPYAVAIVRLEEGVRLPGIIEGVKTPTDVKIGDRVRIRFKRSAHAGELAWPKWDRYVFVKEG